MRKTSVYLPDGLKRSLAEAAARSGLSEAEIIRLAIERELANSDRDRRPLDRPVPGRLVGVGVGPGDPGLVTTAALAALRRADRVVAPSTSVEAVGRAEMIVRQAAPDVAVERLVFEMAPDRSARDEAVTRAAGRVAACLQGGEEVAFITLGDPLVYSTFASVGRAVRNLRPETVVEHQPGIMAFQALAARTGTVLADERQAILVRTALSHDDLEADLRRRDVTLVAYKGGRRLPDVAAAVERAGRSAGAVVGELLGMGGERVAALAEMSAGPASYLATVIVPALEDGQ
ncbi:MAG TPA: precorrin-2 C(20)-methyltransferase [Acidimicrobiales bacterium]|nr:precorrin-2 C(20)-methyltransferase [Acidimicrobiales bacterium]